MKKIFIVVLLFIFCNLTINAAPPQRVKGYHKKNGTYVQTHYRTKADRRKINNYSAKGNYNPYTGKKGYTNPYKIRLKFILKYNFQIEYKTYLKSI